MADKQVWKYPVSIGEFTLDMPEGAIILKVDVQHGQPFLWALVEPEAKPETVLFKVVGTGHNIADAEQWDYVGSFQMFSGDLVFHLFTLFEDLPYDKP